MGINSISSDNHKVIEKNIEKYNINIDLIYRYQNGEKYLIQDIINFNMGLIGLIKAKYNRYVFNNDVSTTELDAAGIIGLIESLNTFDISLGFTFATHAYYNILSEMQSCISAALGIKPGQFIDKRRILGYIGDKKKINPDWNINYNEIADSLKITEKRVKTLLNVTLEKTISLNEKKGNNSFEDGGELIDDISNNRSIEDDIEDEYNKEISKKILGILDEHEKKIIYFRLFGLDGVDKTLEEIGEEMGLTRERVRQIEERGMLKITGAYNIAKILRKKFNKDFSFKHNSLNEIKYLISNYKEIHVFLNFNQKDRSFIESRYNNFIKQIPLEALSIILSIDDIYEYEDNLLDKIETFLNTGKFLLSYYGDDFNNLEYSEFINNFKQLIISKEVEFLHTLNIINLDLLKKDTKEIFSMIMGLDGKEYSIEEVSKKLGINEKKVRDRFKTGLRILKDNISKDGFNNIDVDNQDDINSKIILSEISKQDIFIEEGAKKDFINKVNNIEIIENKLEILETRPYQNEAIGNIFNFVKNILKGTLEKDFNSIFENSAGLFMATGTGKTYTTGKALDKLIKFRNLYNKINKTNKLEKLNIIVLTHRIDLVNQFRDDLIFGRDGKGPIISEDLLKRLHVSTYHSKADRDGKKIDIEEFDLGDFINKDNIIFSTWQTCILKRLDEKINYFDLIIIDESHNIKIGSDYYNLIKKLVLKSRIGKESIILPITATPNNHTNEIFGNPVFDYGLEKYLNSEYSPDVEYNLVTNSNIDKVLIEKMSIIIESSKYITDIKLKKELIKRAELLFSEIMANFIDDESLVDDLFERAEENGEFKETIIFVDSIKTADKLEKIINYKKGVNGYALAFHSKNDKNNALNKLKDKNNQCKIILSIGKLNEGIDLPKVKNIFFWSGTDSETIFFQQFGRGLRGDDLVRYFDYVGGIKNFIWINSIFLKYKDYNKKNKISNGNINSNKRDKFTLIGGNIGATHHGINLVDIGLQIANANEEFNISKEELIEYFKTIKNTEEESYKYLINFNTNDLEELEYKGYKITKLGNILGFKNLNNINLRTLSGFREVVSIIFEKENVLSKENIIEYFKTIKETEEESYNYWMSFKGSDIPNIKYEGKSLTLLLTITGVDGIEKGRIGTIPGFKKFINKIFNTGIKVDEIYSSDFDIEEFKENIYNIKGNKEESHLYLINLSSTEIRNYKYKGLTLINIIDKSGWKNPNKLSKYSKAYFIEGLGFIFGKSETTEVRVTTINKNEIFNYFHGIKGNIIYSYNYLYNLNLSQIRKIKYKGNSITKIATSSGWPNKENLTPSNVKGFKQFINYIFEQKD